MSHHNDHSIGYAPGPGYGKIGTPAFTVVGDTRGCCPEPPCCATVEARPCYTCCRPAPFTNLRGMRYQLTSEGYGQSTVTYNG